MIQPILKHLGLDLPNGRKGGAKTRPRELISDPIKAAVWFPDP